MNHSILAQTPLGVNDRCRRVSAGHPETNEQFAVMSAESYQKRIKQVFDAEGTPAAETVDAVMRDDDQHDLFLERYQEETA
jgi:hypothetical protein